MTCDISNISIIILVKKVQEYKHDMTGENMWMKAPSFVYCLFLVHYSQTAPKGRSKQEAE
jgi:hypothetical protein